MIFKLLVKSKFVLLQPRYNNLFTEKMVRKITFLKDSFFLRTCCYCQAQEIFFKDHPQIIYLRETLHV